MLHDFIKLTASYSVINVFQKLVDYLTVIFFISAFSPYQYGIVSANTLIILGLTSICSLSLEGAIARYYYKYLNKGCVADFLGCIVSYTIILSISIGLLLLLFSKSLWGIIFKDLSFSPYIVLAIFVAMVDPINRVYISCLQIKRSVKEYGIFYNIYVLIRLVLLSAAVFVYHSTEIYFIAYFVGVGVCVPFALYRLSREIRWNLKFSYIKESLSYSIYIVPVTLVALLNGLIGRAFIMDKMDTISVGVYSAGFNVGQIIYLIAMVFNMAYISFFIQKYEEIGDDVGKVVGTMTDIMFFLVFVAAFLLSIISPLFIPLLPDDYVFAISLIPLFAFTGVANGLYFLSTNFLSLKQPLVKYKLFGLLFGVLLNIVISACMLDLFGIIAAALGNFVSIYVSSCILLWISRKLGGFVYSTKVYWLTPALLVVTYVCFYLINISSWSVRLFLLPLALLCFYVIFDRYFFIQKNFITRNFITIYNRYVKTIHF